MSKDYLKSGPVSGTKTKGEMRRISPGRGARNLGKKLAGSSRISFYRESLKRVE